MTAKSSDRFPDSQSGFCLHNLIIFFLADNNASVENDPQERHKTIDQDLMHSPVSECLCGLFIMVHHGLPCALLDYIDYRVVLLDNIVGVRQTVDTRKMHVGCLAGSASHDWNVSTVLVMLFNGAVSVQCADELDDDTLEDGDESRT